MHPVRANSIGRGFAEPVFGAQRTFRSLLAAMSEPGCPHVLDQAIECPSGIAQASMLVLLTMVDADTLVWLPRDCPEIASYLRFHTGAPIAVDPQDAQFAWVGRGSGRPELDAFNAGDERYPDRSATIIAECPSRSKGQIRQWSGPGIKGTRAVAVNAPWNGFWQDVATNGERFPRGLDFILVTGHEVIGLPRTTRITPTTETG